MLKKRSRRWIFTTFTIGEQHKKQILEIDCKFVEFQLEETPTSQIQHYQGYIIFENAKSGRAVKKLLPGQSHIENMRGNVQQNKVYCSKERTKIEGPWSAGDRPATAGKLLGSKKKAKDPMENLEYHDWQQEIIDIIEEEADTRKIYWYHEAEGGVGKSVFTKHLVLKYGAVVCNGSAKDMMYFISSQKQWPTIVVFDVPRAKSKDFLSYEGIEKIKDGCFLSTKYESGMCVYDPPHVICFANWAPDQEKLSKDRWLVKDISAENWADKYDFSIQEE